MNSGILRDLGVVLLFLLLRLMNYLHTNTHAHTQAPPPIQTRSVCLKTHFQMCQTLRRTEKNCIFSKKEGFSRVGRRVGGGVNSVQPASPGATQTYKPLQVCKHQKSL